MCVGAVYHTILSFRSYSSSLLNIGEYPLIHLFNKLLLTYYNVSGTVLGSSITNTRQDLTLMELKF